MTDEFDDEESLGRVLYRHPPESGIARLAVMTATLVLPWLLLPLFSPGSSTYLSALFGSTISTALAFIIEASLRRKRDDAIHEHGARVTIDGRPVILWFTEETLVTEVHEILRDYGAARADQWLFELRSGDRVATIAADAPRSAERIRRALFMATGQEPARTLRGTASD